MFHLLPQRRLLIWSRPRTVASATPVVIVRSRSSVLSVPSCLLLCQRQKLCYRRPDRLLLRQRGKTWLKLATDPKMAAGPPFWGCDFTLHALGYQIRRPNGVIWGHFWRHVSACSTVSYCPRRGSLPSSPPPPWRCWLPWGSCWPSLCGAHPHSHKKRRPRAPFLTMRLKSVADRPPVQGRDAAAQAMALSMFYETNCCIHAKYLSPYSAKQRKAAYSSPPEAIMPLSACLLAC